MSANSVKVDPRTKRTLKLLQTAMTELLNEQEFSKITVQDITERAEVNRATFYDHFVDKFELLNYLIREDFQARLQGKLPASPTLTLDNLRVLTVIVCDYLAGFIGHCAPSVRYDEQMMMVREVQLTTHDVILKWLHNAQIRPSAKGVPLEMIATMISFTIFGSVMDWTQTGRKISVERLTEQVLSLLTSGIDGFLTEGV